MDTKNRTLQTTVSGLIYLSLTIGGMWPAASQAVEPRQVIVRRQEVDRDPGRNDTYAAAQGIPRAPFLFEGFEGGIMPPSGWTRIIHDSAYPTTTWSIDSFDAYTGNYCASCFFDLDLRAQDEVLLSPQFKASTALLEFYSFGSLYWCRDQHDNCDLNIWLVIGEWDGGTGDDVFIGKADPDWTAAYVWSPSTMDLTLYLPADQPVRVGFQYKGQNGAQVALDSILLETSLLAPSLSPIENADGDGSYLIDWTDVVSATGYLLEEDESPAFGSPTARYSGPNSEYTVSGQPPGTWYYRVKASDGQSDSRWSNTEMAGVKPNAPTLSSISNPSGGGSYLIDWTDVASATSYVLEEDDNSSFDSPTTRYSGAASEYSVSGQLPDTWYYRVKASAAAGDSPWSNTQSVRVSIRIYVPLIVRQAGAHQLFSK